MTTNRLQRLAQPVHVSNDVPCRCGKGKSPEWRREVHWVKINGRSVIDWCPEPTPRLVRYHEQAGG